MPTYNPANTEQAGTAEAPHPIKTSEAIADLQESSPCLCIAMQAMQHLDRTGFTVNDRSLPSAKVRALRCSGEIYDPIRRFSGRGSGNPKP